MSTIFISHSSFNNPEAIRIREWLLAHGWGSDQIFLDIDNLVTGDRWRVRLNEIGANCEAVIVCLSDGWINSPECVREFTHAESRGKPIFPVKISDISVKIPSFIQDLQIADISSENQDNGFTDLERGLVSARIGPKYFPWPPHNDPERKPYRGLRALEESDAAIFFGRDAAITKGLDELRRLRHGVTEKILVILGSSGAGKSSFLKAGLLSRLRRDTENFKVLEILRPENAALKGEQGLNAALLNYDKCEPTELHGKKQPTFILPIDQGEEFFSSENKEGSDALRQICEILQGDPNIIAVITIRSDSYEHLQKELSINNIEPHLFNLPALSPSAFADIIKSPGLLVEPNIIIEDEVVEQLYEDLGRRNALPLLAFTLEQLIENFSTNNRVELSIYIDELKGLKGAIDSAFNAAIEAAIIDETLPNSQKKIENLARRTFIPWLVKIESNSLIPKRRRCKRSDLSKEANRLLDHLINQRLLFVDVNTSNGKNEVTVEVTHEAVLQYWQMLTDWLQHEASNLILLDRLSSAASDWVKHNKSSDWLIHRGQRLSTANYLIEDETYINYVSIEINEYLNSCEGKGRGRKGFFFWK